MARMYYALQSVQYNNGVTSAPFYGVQNIGASSTSDRTPVFQLGMLGTYSSYQTDDSPVEVTISKQVDGRALLYPTLVGLEGSDTASLQFNFWTSAGQASGDGSATPTKSLAMKKFTISSVSYSFEVDGVGTEEITLIGDGLSPDDAENVVYMDSSISSASDLATRARVKFINGGSPDGYQSVSFSNTTNVESLYTLGKFKNTERYIVYPSETTIDFVQAVTSMDNLGDTSVETVGSCSSTSQGEQPLSIELCDGTKIGVTNGVLTNQSYAGGGTDNSQLELTSSYTAWDSFYVVTT